MKDRSIAVAHLRRQCSDIVFVKQVTERADLHLEQVGSFGLVAGGFSERLDHICFL